MQVKVKCIRRDFILTYPFLITDFILLFETLKAKHRINLLYEYEIWVVYFDNLPGNMNTRSSLFNSFNLWSINYVNFW